MCFSLWYVFPLYIRGVFKKYVDCLNWVQENPLGVARPLQSFTFLNIRMWFNSESTTTERFKVKDVIFIYSTTELNSSKIFLQLSKCTSVVLKWDYHNWMLRRSVRDWFLKLKSSSRKLRFFPFKCTNLGFSSQSQTCTWIKTSLSKPIIDCLKCVLTNDFVLAIKLLT